MIHTIYQLCFLKYTGTTSKKDSISKSSMNVRNCPSAGGEWSWEWRLLKSLTISTARKQVLKTQLEPTPSGLKITWYQITGDKASAHWDNETHTLWWRLHCVKAVWLYVGLHVTDEHAQRSQHWANEPSNPTIGLLTFLPIGLCPPWKSSLS